MKQEEFILLINLQASTLSKALVVDTITNIGMFNAEKLLNEIEEHKEAYIPSRSFKGRLETVNKKAGELVLEKLRFKSFEYRGDTLTWKEIKPAIRAFEI